MTRQRRAYSEGDYLVICARSGQKALRSDCVKEWDGSIVLREYSETRHPLDFPSPPGPESVPLDTRPPGEDSFLEYGDVTADSLGPAPG